MTERLSRQQKAMRARAKLELEALQTHFVADEAQAKALADGLPEEPVWMRYLTRTEFENVEFGFDWRMRRLPLDVDVFLFLDLCPHEMDMHDWVKPGIFDAVTRLHACGQTLHLALLSAEPKRPAFAYERIEMSQREERDAAVRAQIAWRRVERLAQDFHFVKGEAEACELHRKLEPSAWMQFKSELEFVKEFDPRMRRLMLGISIFLFLDFPVAEDPTHWLDQVIFDATVRLHAHGAKLYIAGLDPDESRRRLEADETIADASAPPP